MSPVCPEYSVTYLAGRTPITSAVLPSPHPATGAKTVPQICSQRVVRAGGVLRAPLDLAISIRESSTIAALGGAGAPAGQIGAQLEASEAVRHVLAQRNVVTGFPRLVEEVEAYVREHWSEVTRIAEALMQTGTITAQDLDSLLV